MSEPSVNSLLLVAMQEEARPLLERLGDRVRLIDSRGYRSVHRCGTTVIAVSGIGGHNMSAAASSLLSCFPNVKSVANFGSAGAYPGAGLPGGSIRCVSRVCKWDLHLPLAEFDQHFTALEIATEHCLAAGLDAASCNSGCSFSTAEDRLRPGFPQAQLEDMELYSLAALCQAHELPLWSLKFVSNQVGETAVDEFNAGFHSNLETATDVLEGLLGNWSQALSGHG